VNAVKWTGDNLIITGASDKEIRVWNAEDGRTIRVLLGHAHWVNSLALSSDHALRTGAYDHTGKRFGGVKEEQEVRVPVLRVLGWSSTHCQTSSPTLVRQGACAALRDCTM
jgi:WD40 repeat protein